jgi:DNA-binding transcriptional ArsR family regulator
VGVRFVKLEELLSKLDEKQRKTILKAYEENGIPNLELELDAEVDEESLEFLKSISNPLRIRILKLLKDDWLCVCVISSYLERDQTLISHHLRTLKKAGLLKEKKVGKMHFYKTDTEEVFSKLERLKKLFE